MLKPIDEFSMDERFTALIKGWCAIDPETGAFLSSSRGRPKAGNGFRYILILPIEPVQERGLFGPYTWDNPRRKFIRAWDDQEAIKLANEKLNKMTYDLAGKVRLWE